MRILVKASMLFCLCGCSSMHTIDCVQPANPVKTIAVKEFESKDQVAGKLFAQVIESELLRAGFVISDPNDSDVVITGAISYGEGGWITGIDSWIDSVIATVKNNGKFLFAVRFDQGSLSVNWWGAKSPADIASQISREIIKKMKRE